MQKIKDNVHVSMLGGYSFAVTLPRSWVLAHEGKKISMFLDEQNRLILAGVE